MCVCSILIVLIDDAPTDLRKQSAALVLHRFYLTQDNDSEKFGVSAGGEAVWMIAGMIFWEAALVEGNIYRMPRHFNVDTMISCEDSLKLSVRREQLGAFGVSIFPMNNAEPLQATHRVSQPSNSWLCWLHITHLLHSSKKVSSTIFPNHHPPSSTITIYNYTI